MNIDNSLQNILNKKYDTFSLEEKKILHQLYDKSLIDDSLKNIKSKLEKVIFRLIPPTPQEYLDYKNGWVTKGFTDSIYDHVKEDFLEILDKNKNYTQVVQYGATRLGKSFLTRMIIHYIMIYVHCLRYPQLYYGLSPTTNLSIYIMSFVTEKVNQLLLKPIFDILEMSPRFLKIDRQDQVKIKQEELGLETIVWSKAATFGKITLESKLSLNIGTDFLSFMGADLLFLSVSEINFFIQQAGTTHEEIFQLYTDGLERIEATVGNQYLGMIFLDSSANDTENPIEKYILHDLKKQKGIFFKARSRWEARPYKFPVWQKTGETFKICTGDGNIHAHIITNELELKTLNSDLIIDVPIDVKPAFERALIKSIKDIAGRPTNRENKLIQDMSIVYKMFDDNLNNVEGIIIADAKDSPHQLIWNKIFSIFFIKTIDEKWRLKRSPNEPRWIHVDHAFAVKGDLMSIAMGHKERSIQKMKTFYIIDFCFVIGPGKTGINLQALENFIDDLRILGGVYIKQVSADTFQSEQFKQNLNRKNINTIKTSIDLTIDPYVCFINNLYEEKIKMGKNIFVKNNLSSLITLLKNNKEKIDHIQGETYNTYDGNWEKSLCGKNAKDASDCVCGVVWEMENDNLISSTVYENENIKYSENLEENKDIIKVAFDKLQGF